MVKFLASSGQRQILGIGLSRGNVEKLMAGQPIHFHREQMHLPELRADEVLIFFGETEDSMRAELAKNGYLDNAHIVNERPRKH